jgi:hypothetical protein
MTAHTPRNSANGTQSGENITHHGHVATIVLGMHFSISKTINNTKAQLKLNLIKVLLFLPMIV